MFRTLIRCAAPNTLALGLAGVIAGSACALLGGKLDVLPMILMIFFVGLTVLGANLTGAYFFEKYNAQEMHEKHLFFAGRNEFVPKEILREAISACCIGAAMFGVALLTRGAWWWALVYFAALGAVYLNVAKPFRLSYTPVGLLFAFIFFGPAVVLATYYFQVISVTSSWGSLKGLWLVGYMSVIIGLYALNALLVAGYVQYDIDMASGRTSFSTRFGRKAARIFVSVVDVVIAALGVLMFTTRNLPGGAWMILLIALNFGINCMVIKRLNFGQYEGRTNATVTYNLQMWNAFIFALGSFLYFCFVHLPSQSTTTYF